MKAKTIPILGFIILMTSLGYGGWLLASQTPTQVNAHDIFRLKENKTDFKVPTKQEIAAVEEIQKKLILIANPQLDKRSGIDLKLFGQNKVVSQYNYKNAKLEVDTDFTYDITFTFISKENKYCYINKTFYTLGDVMPDGGKISSIKTNQVLIVKNNISEWIPVKTQTDSATDPQQKD